MPRPRLALPASRISRSIPALLATGLITLLTAAPAGAFQGPWALPATTLSAAGQSVLDPQIAAAPDGAATAVWSRSNGTNTIVQASTRPPGASFSSPIDLSALGQDASFPQVTAAPDGTTTVVWTRSNGTNTIVQASTRPPGGSFSSPIDLSALGQNATAAQVEVGADGTTTVVWSRSNGTNRIVQASTRPPGGSFSSPVDLSATGQDANEPQVAIAADGKTTVVWTRSDGANPIAQVSTRSPGTAFSSPLDLSAPGQNANDPQVAVAADGTTTAVWRRSDGTNTIVQASTRPPGGSFAGAIDLSGAGQDASGPQVAGAPDGSITAVWIRSNGTYFVIQTSTRPANGSFGSPVDLSAADQNAFSPQVAIAPDGTATSVWLRSNALSEVVQSSTRPPGGAGFGGPLDLSTLGTDANEPQLAVASDGAVTAVWPRSNGANHLAEASSTANPPALRSAPKILGTPAQGSTLSCDGGLWTGAASVTTSWLRDGATIATGPTYAVAGADQGRALLCHARATNPFGNAEAQSLPVVVAATPAAAPDRTAPTLTVLTKARLTRAQFRNGVSVRISANERTTVLAELLARAKGAKISAVPYNLVLGSRTGRNVQNSVTLRIKPNRTLVGKARSFSIRLRLTAEDAAGNRRVTGKTIKVAG